MRPKEDRFPLGGDTAFQKALVEAAGAAVWLCRGHAHSIQESVLPFPPCGFWGDGDQAQVTRLVGKHLCLLSHVARPKLALNS